MVDQGYLLDFYKVFKALHSYRGHFYLKLLICKYLTGLVVLNKIKEFRIDEGLLYDIYTLTIRNVQYYDERLLTRLFKRIEFISLR